MAWKRIMDSDPVVWRGSCEVCGVPMILYAGAETPPSGQYATCRRCQVALVDIATTDHRAKAQDYVDRHGLPEWVRPSAGRKVLNEYGIGQRSEIVEIEE